MCNYKDLNIEVTGVESPISKKIFKKFNLSRFKEHRKGGLNILHRNVCTSQLNYPVVYLCSVGIR